MPLTLVLTLVVASAAGCDLLFGPREIEGLACADGACPEGFGCNTTTDTCSSEGGAGEGEGEAGEGEGEAGEGEGEAGEGEGEAGEGEGEGEGEGTQFYGVDVLNPPNPFPSAGSGVLLSAGDNVTLNTSAETLAGVALTGTAVIDGVLIVHGALQVEATSTLHIVGARPVVFITADPVFINGVIDASGHGPTPGPGGGPGGPPHQPGVGAGNSGGLGVIVQPVPADSAGGGGGGHAGQGGQGAADSSGNDGPPGGGVAGFADLHILAGGAGGGGANTPGGGGGGALAIVSLAAVTVSAGGAIRAEGGGGTDNAVTDRGGGGGGSGGAVFLEAPLVAIEGIVSVRGGLAGENFGNNSVDGDLVKNEFVVGAPFTGSGGGGRVRIHTSTPLDFAAQIPLRANVLPQGECAAVTTFGTYVANTLAFPPARHPPLSFTPPSLVRAPDGSDEGVGGFVVASGGRGLTTAPGANRAYAERLPVVDAGFDQQVTVSAAFAVAAGVDAVTNKVIVAVSSLTGGNGVSIFELDDLNGFVSVGPATGFAGNHSVDASRLAMSNDATTLWVGAFDPAAGGVLYAMRRDPGPSNTFAAVASLATAPVFRVAGDNDAAIIISGLTTEVTAFDLSNADALTVAATDFVLPGGENVRGVALQGGVLAIGMPDIDTCTVNGGVVRVLERSSFGDPWVTTHEVAAPDPSDGLRFGASVAIDAGGLAVGASRQDAQQVGAAFVFRDLFVGPARYAPVLGLRLGAHFGEAIDLADGIVVVGAPADGPTGKGSFAGAFSVDAVPAP